MNKLSAFGLALVFLLIMVGLGIAYENAQKSQPSDENMQKLQSSDQKIKKSSSNSPVSDNSFSGEVKHPDEPKPSPKELPKPVQQADSVRYDEVKSSLMITPNPNNSSIPWILQEDELPLMGKGRRYMHSLNPNYWKYIKHVEPNWNIEHIYVIVPCQTGVCLEAVADYIMESIRNPSSSSVLIHTKDDRYNVNAWQNLCSDSKVDNPYTYDRTYYIYNKNRGNNHDLPQFLLYNWNDSAFVKKMELNNIYPPKSASGNCKSK